MEKELLYLLAADLILLLHVLIVGFIVFGLVFTIIGKVLSWNRVRNPWFRILHLIAIGIVVLQSWLGRICPLTIWETELRKKAGDVTYTGSFIAHWLQEILYYQAPAWVFTLIYTVFGSLVIFTWFWVRPKSFRKNYGDDF